MRYPDATWRGTDKHGYGDFDTHSHEGVVIHSAEGSLAGAFSVLDGPRQASWHFFVTKTGEVYQHVDTDQIAWTNGSREANTKFWGVECEGVAGEALTELQFQALVQVVRWLWATYQVGAAVRQETLWEHNEMTRYGAPATACPSGRIPWAALINELEGDMADDATIKGWITDAIKAAFATHSGDGSRHMNKEEMADNLPRLNQTLQDVVKGIAAQYAGGETLEEIADGLEVELKVK